MFQPTRYISRLIATIAIGAICGCTEPTFEKLFSTDHFDYYIEQGATAPCDGTGEWLERYYEANAKFFGVELPAGEKIQYHQVDSRKTMAWAGCAKANGCAYGTVIYAAFPTVISHEIVHANASLLGHPPLLFTEGIADVLSCTVTSDANGWLDTSASIENLVESSSFSAYQEDHSSRVYPTAASFVRYLLDRFGAEKFLALYAEAPYGASRDETSVMFEKEMGVRLDDAFDEWRKMPPQLAGDVCLRLMECGDDIPDFVDGEVHTGCGPSGGFLSSHEALLRFHVTEGKTLHAAMTPSVTQPQMITTVSFFRCGGGDVTGRGDNVGGFRYNKDQGLYIDPKHATRRFTLDMPAGDYFARFSAGAKTEIHSEVIESSGPMRNGCVPTSEPLVLRHDEDVVLTSRWTERPCIGFWCPGHSWDVEVGPTGGSIVMNMAGFNSQMPFAPDKVYLCAKPCPAYPDECEVVTFEPTGAARSQSSQVFAPGTIVHVGAPLAAMKDHFSIGMRLIPP